MASGSVTFEYTGASQSFTVPAGVTGVFIQCWGAPGGTGTVLDVTSQNGVSGDVGPYAISPLTDSPSVIGQLYGARSLVGYVSGFLSVTPGHTYTVIVGGGGGYGNSNTVAGQGATTNGGPGGYGGGFFDGGDGGYWLQPAAFADRAAPGSGGGGGSGVIDGAAVICVGGGGGGAASPISVLTGTASATSIAARENPTAPIPPFLLTVDFVPITGAYFGGPGGGSLAASGGSTVTLSGGAGGTQSAPGSGGARGATGFFSSSNAGAAGSGGNGGNGANNHTAGLSLAPGGGGGGGGYFGGGGGSDDGSGGGGGSNFTGGGALSRTTSIAAVNPQGPNGRVVISWSLQPPDAPTLIRPVANREVNIKAVLNLEWAFSSAVAGATQGSFDIEYQLVTGGAYTTINVSGDATTYSLPALLWATGQTIIIGVRVYDQFGAVSSYTTRTVTTVTGPVAPTITAPATNGTITTPSFLISATWPSSPVGQYQGRILDADGNVLYDSGKINNSRFNLCPNPNFAVDASSWAVSAGSIASSTTFHKSGTTSGKIIWPTATALSAYAAVNFATLPGETYSVSCWVTVGNATTDPKPVLAVCNVGSEGSPFAFAVVSPVGGGSGTAGTFVLATVQFVATATTTRALIMNSASVTAGAVCYVGAVLCEETESPVTSFFTYFDGSSTNGSWTGTAGKSTSKKTLSDPGSVGFTWGLPSQGGLTMQMRYSALSVGDQVFSDWTSHTGVSVNINPPGTPTAVLTTDAVNGTISIAITNSNTPNATISNDIYRTDLTNGTPEIRIATGIAPNATFVDYTPATNTTYAYRVRALSAGDPSYLGTNAGYADVS